MENIILNSNEIETFRSQGYLGPYSLCSADEMMKTAKQIESVLNTDPPDHKNRVHNRHLDNQLIHQVSPHLVVSDQIFYLIYPVEIYFHFQSQS